MDSDEGNILWWQSFFVATRARVFSTVALNYTAGIYGDAAIAAMSIVNRITMFVMSMVVV